MEFLLEELDIRVPTRDLHNYIAIEGPIGVGKTSLTRSLAYSLNYETLLERPEDNPFLNRFYADRLSYALPTQLHFLFQRVSQLQDIMQRDLFGSARIADFLIDKDPLFAQTNLDKHELALYQKVFQNLSIELPFPDLVVYLQAPTEILMERIRKRGIDSEQGISDSYLERLNENYMHYFHHFQKTALLVVNAAEIDFVSDKKQYALLVETILNTRRGRHFFNPLTRDI